MVPIAAITTILQYSQKHGGVFPVESSSSAIAFRFGPAAIGSVTTIWWKVVASNLARLTPYISMAAKRNPVEGNGYGHRKVQRTLNAYYADGLIEPNIFDVASLARNGLWLLFLSCITLIIVTLLLVSLKAAFVQTTPTSSGWDISVSPAIGYALISMYGLLVGTTLAILVRLYNRHAGLKWDPVSVADQLALLQGSNIGSPFTGLKTFTYWDYRRWLHERVPAFGPIRLGYWKHKTTGEVWHGIAAVSKTTVGKYISILLCGLSDISDNRTKHQSSQMRLLKLKLRETQMFQLWLSMAPTFQIHE